MKWLCAGCLRRPRTDRTAPCPHCCGYTFAELATARLRERAKAKRRAA